MLLAARIDDAMKEKGWKKKDLADELSKLPSEITKWLSGTHNFTTETLWDIERVLGIELIALEERKKEHVITIQLSTTEMAEVEPQASFEQLFFGEGYTMQSGLKEQLIKNKKRTFET